MTSSILQIAKNIPKFFHKTLYFIPHIGLILSIVLILLFIFLKQWSILSYASLFLIPVIIICVIFLLNKSNIPINMFEYYNDNYTLSNISESVCTKIYWSLFFFTLAWVLMTNGRDVIFLLLLLLMYCICIIQLFTKSHSYMWVVIQLIFTSLLATLSKNFIYYTSYGIEDPIIHASWISQIVLDGSTAPLGASYGNYPLMHITGAETSILTSLGSLNSIQLIGAIAVLIGVVFVYYISLHITLSKKVAALSCLFYLLTPVVLKYAWNITPRSFGSLAFLMIIYLLISTRNWNKISVIICSLILGLYLSMIHHAQLPLYIIAMTILCIAYIIYMHHFSKNQIITILAFYLIPIFYFIYHYLGNIIWIFDVYYGKTTSIISDNSVSGYFAVDISAYYLSYIIPSIFITVFSLLGMYFIIYSQKSYKNIKILLPISLLFIIYVDPVFKYIPISDLHSFVLRFQIVLVPFFAIIMGIGCVVLLIILRRYLKSNTKAIVSISIILLLFVVASPICYSSKDDTIFVGTDLYEKSYFNQDDMVLFNYASEHIPSKSNIYLDLYSNLMILSLNHNYNREMMSTLFMNNTLDYESNHYMIFREYEYLHDGIVVSSKDYSNLYINRGYSLQNDEIYHYYKMLIAKSNLLYGNGLSNIMYLY